MTENREVANITDVITILVSFSIKNANFFFITMSMTGCGVKVASQTVKSIKLG